MKRIFCIAMIMAAALAMAAEAGEANEYKAIFESSTEEDYRALEKVVFNESACCNCSHEVNVAVVETVLNRVLSDEWPGYHLWGMHPKGAVRLQKFYGRQRTVGAVQ